VSEPEPAGTATDDDPARRRSRLGPLLVGLVMIAVGLVLLWQIFEIPAEGFGMQGPRFFPAVVVAIWLGLAVIYLAQHVVSLRRSGPGLPAARFDRAGPMGLLVLILVVYAFALDPLGYWIATSLLFIASARTLGSRRLRRDVIIGVALSLVVYLLFTRALGVRLPEGVLGL